MLNHRSPPIWSALFILPGLLALTHPTSGYSAVHYVDLASSGALPPYLSWATAATTIQDAIDAADPGDQIMVADGTYQTGGRVAAESATPTPNRISVTKPLTIQSVHGPQTAIIQGYQLPDQTNGDGAIRCAYLTNGASLVGFTLTGGGTRIDSPSCGGGILCESTQAVVSNCIITGNCAAYWGGGANGGTLLNCIISSNVAWLHGGGAAGPPPGSSSDFTSCSLSNCTVVGNITSPAYGGAGATDADLINSRITANINIAVFRCNMTNCLISDNQGGGGVCTASNCTFSNNAGSGAYLSDLDHCTLMGNSSPDVGGGARGGFVKNCLIYNNTAAFGGGGTAEATVVNSLILSNSAPNGGGDMASTHYNCTLVGNWATIDAGGTFRSTMNNCIIYYNTAPDNENNDPTGDGVSINFCCTTPPPPVGTGNITTPPLFLDLAAGNLQLQSNSPCINAGNNDYSTIYDSYGNPIYTAVLDFGGSSRISGGIIDIGAYEFQLPSPPPPPLLSIAAFGTQVVLSWPASATNYVLEATPSLTTNSIWLQQTQGIATNAATFVVTNNPVGLTAFYRLRLAR